MSSSPQESFGPEHAPVVRVPDLPNDSDQQPDSIAEADSDGTGAQESDAAVLDDAGQPTPSEPGEPSA
jgi:hypothetical protein